MFPIKIQLKKMDAAGVDKTILFCTAPRPEKAGTLMRAVGMEGRQLKRMISAEAYTYAVSGLVVGCGIGIPLSRFLYICLITHFFGMEWKFPILWFGIIFVFIFVSAIAAVYAPAKRICNMPITATINEL